MDRVRGRGLKSIGTRRVLLMLGFIHPCINNNTQLKAIRPLAFIKIKRKQQENLLDFLAKKTEIKQRGIETTLSFGRPILAGAVATSVRD